MMKSSLPSLYNLLFMSLILNIDLKEAGHAGLENTDVGFYNGLIESQVLSYAGYR